VAMASIAKAQASLLKTGFLDKPGTAGQVFPETLTEVQVIAGELARAASDNLANTKHIASGELAASITVENPVQDGTRVSVSITMLFYGAYINSGVKGTKSGRSTAGYSFKYPLPSKKMVDAIRAWIKSGKKATRNTGKRTYGKHESKRKSVGAAGADAAFPIARAIVQRGIKPTGFMDKAIKTTAADISARLGARLEVDIINYLKK
jgi:hypothetical protein